MPKPIRRDFADRSPGHGAGDGGSDTERRTSPPRLAAMGLGVATVVASATFANLPEAPNRLAQSHHLSLAGLSPTGTSQALDINPLQPAGAKQQATAPDGRPEGPGWESYELRRGENLSQLGQRADISAATALALARASADVFPSRRMRPGHAIHIRRSEAGAPAEIRYEIDDRRYVRWQRDGSDFTAEVQEYPVTTHVKEAFGKVESSLFRAGERAGLPEKVTMELARIFGWDIDFTHDLRRGDWFRVLYQEVYRDGERIGTGDILAAEFVTRGESHRAIRFTDGSGRTDYYQPNGRSVRKAFLRSPVKFSRITSRFSRSRDHPILERRRAHMGVDYGAPTGTPVRATGDGRVIFRGWKGGYGRVVMLRHAGRRYTTVYAHMSGFDSDARDGARVKQGETIGYVGQSGLATGPHLHYEFQIRGRHRNPLKVDLPQARPLADKYQQAFSRKRHHLEAWLEAVGPAATRLAEQGEGNPPS